MCFFPKPNSGISEISLEDQIDCIVFKIEDEDLLIMTLIQRVGTASYKNERELDQVQIENKYSSYSSYKTFVFVDAGGGCECTQQSKGNLCVNTIVLYSDHDGHTSLHM